jgi:hypothetical protein
MAAGLSRAACHRTKAALTAAAYGAIRAVKRVKRLVKRRNSIEFETISAEPYLANRWRARPGGLLQQRHDATDAMKPARTRISSNSLIFSVGAISSIWWPQFQPIFFQMGRTTG